MKATLFILLAVLVCYSLAKTVEIVEKEIVEEEETVRIEEDEAHETKHSEEHPCATKQCGEGYECDIDEEGIPICICLRECQQSPTQIAVCTTQNVTFESECEYKRQKCLCHHQDTHCKSIDYASAHMDYYGSCIEMQPCLPEDLEEFPVRMRDWLYLIMEELDERQDLNEGAQNMVKEARVSKHRWVLPTIWKFCELDITYDSFVDPEELVPITAPLKPLEHCTGTFLEQCDVDNNGRIDLIEWGTCLGLEDSEIQDRCAELQD